MELQNNENISVEQQKSKRGRPKTVNGNYDNKKYYQTFKLKNSEKIKEKNKCELCGGVFSYYNRFHHNSSLKHKDAKQKQLLMNMEKKEEDFKKEIQNFKQYDDKIIEFTEVLETNVSIV